MNHRQGAGEGRVLQVRVILAELVGRQHPFVDDAIGRQGTDIEVISRRGGNIAGFKFDDIFSALAHKKQPALKIGPVEKRRSHPQKDLANLRLGFQRRRPDMPIIDRHIAPGDHFHPILLDDSLKNLLALAPRRGILRKKNRADGVVPRRR
jgi:hypothetical protein